MVRESTERERQRHFIAIPACDGGADATTFCAFAFPGPEMTKDGYANALIDGGDAPAVADIKTQLEREKTRSSPTCALGVQR